MFPSVTQGNAQGGQEIRGPPLARSASLTDGGIPVGNSACADRAPSASSGRLPLTGRRYRITLEVICDVLAWVCGLIIAGWLSHDLAGSPIGFGMASRATATVIIASATAGLVTGLYRARFQRGSPEEAVRAAGAAGTAMLLLALAGNWVIPGQRAELGTVAGAAVFVTLTMLGTRHATWWIRQQGAPSPTAVKVIIFGAGSAGTQLVHRLVGQPAAEYRPVAILDDDPDKRKLRIRGVAVTGDRSAMAEVAAETGARLLVIAIARADGSVIRDLSAQAEACGLIPKVIPSVKELLGGGAAIDGVRDPRISDLLGRQLVKTDVAAVEGYFAAKRILVTGAGGSIGSELCRQLHRLNPAELIMLDRDESALHALQLALHGRALLDSDEVALADIRDPDRVRQVFEKFRPHVVFHTAALKHLPLLERFPAEAVKSNVRGTLAVLEAAAEIGVETFVNISTDKAANPVSVLGYSKRIAERLTSYMSGQAAGTYLSVRFGNVLGSRGSFLTSLSAQIAAGGPVTITDPDVTRYFMTVDEAVQLVLQAAVIGRDGEVLVLDMGEPVRVADLARRLSATSARNIEIKFTGLRPGEKLAEDLLGDGERAEYRQHPLIRHAAVPPLAPCRVSGLGPAASAHDLQQVLSQDLDAAVRDVAASGSALWLAAPGARPGWPAGMRRHRRHAATPENACSTSPS